MSNIVAAAVPKQAEPPDPDGSSLRTRTELADTSLQAEDLPIPIASFDREQRYCYVNRAWETFLGRSRNTVIGKTILEVTGPENDSAAQVYVHQVLEGQQATFLSTLRHADGSLRHVEVSYSPLRNEAGIITGFSACLHIRTHEDQDSEACARLAAIVDSSDDVIVSKTFDGMITSWNRAAEKIFGYTAEEAIGQHITLIIPPHKWQEAEQVLERLRRGEKIDHFETERRARDGRTIYVSLSVSPIRNARGELIGASKVARDITERKRAEEALQRSEQYRKAVLDSMPECVKVVDRNGTVLHMNPAGLRMVQANSPDEVIGKCVYPLIDEEHRAAFQSMNESVFNGGSGGRLEFGFRGLRGQTRIFESNVVPLRGEGEQTIGALSVTRDVTARREAERRDAFLIHLDHEIRALADPEEMTGTAARLLCRHLGADRCSYAELHTDEGVLDIIGHYSENLPDITGRYTIASFGEAFITAMTAGRAHVVCDTVRELPSDASEAYRRIGSAAVVAIPLIKDGQLVAGMGVHQATPREWREDEIELIRVVANRCWESIQRARAERELRAREEQFRTLANTIPNLAWMAHADGHLYWYNQRWYNYTGTTPEQMMGWGWRDVHRADLLPQVMQRWKESLISGQPFEMVFPLRRADGQFRSFLTRVEPLRDDTGNIVRWLGTNTDITDQLDAEEREKKARRTAERLNRIGPMLAAELDARKLTQTITDIATEAVGAKFGAFFQSLVDEQGRSYVLYTLSGAPREAFAGFPMPRNTLVFGPTFRGEGVVRSDDIAKDPRYGKSAPFHGMPPGHLSVRSYLAVPVISRTGDVLGGLFFGHPETGVFTNESENIVTGIAAQSAIALDNAALFEQARRSGDALRRSNEELRRLNDDLNQFAFSASHDLREPLRMISIYTQFLGRKLAGKLDDETGVFLERILRGAARMEALVRDLLAYTQAAEPGDPENARANGTTALNQALANLSAIIEEAEAKITTASLPEVRIPEVRLAQLFQNLIGNAVKYRRPVPLEVEVKTVRRGTMWEFSVTDNGIGIEEQYSKQIFGVFKRLHTIDDYPGTGIGLAICQRIIQRAGGSIWVESVPGEGSTFLFTLPAVD